MKNKIIYFITNIFFIVIIMNNHILFLNSLKYIENVQLIIDIISKVFYSIFSLYIVYKSYSLKDIKLSSLEKSTVVIFDLFFLISNSFINNGSLSYIFENIIYNVLLFISLYMIISKYLLVIKEKIKIIKFSNKKTKFIKVFNKNPFLLSFIIILLCWTIYIIAFYPMILSKDPSYQLLQFFNIKTKYADYAVLLDENIFLTNHHPVFHTMLLGLCYKVGSMLINDNFGLFLFSLIQILSLCSVFAYTIKYLKENDVDSKWLLVILGIYSLVPVFPKYAMTSVKDTLYTCLFILYLIRIHKLMNNKYFNYRDFLILLLIMIFISIIRNNGIYVIVLSLPLLIIKLKDFRKELILLFLGCIIFYGTYSKVLLPSLGITDGSVRETLSIPFQQTARLAKYKKNAFSDNDKKVIDKVLNYKTLAKRYNPKLADPVKNKYNKYTTSKELKDYFKVWFKGLIKHPIIYIEATLNNIYGYFSPQETNWYVYSSFNDIINKYGFNYSYNKLEILRKCLNGYALAFPFIPIFGLLVNIGFNTWLLILLAIYSLKNKKYNNMILLSPLFITLLVCVASPVNTYFRYAMPIVFSMPFMFTLIVKSLKKQ